MSHKCLNDRLIQPFFRIQTSMALLAACLTFETLFPPAASAQTRINPPKIYSGAYQQKSTLDDTNVSTLTRTFLMSTNIEAPIPIKAAYAMPYLRADYSLFQSTTKIDSTRKESTKEIETVLTSSNSIVALGLLHHADEGAPVWKFDLGRLGVGKNMSTSSPYLTTKTQLNLEKIFPSLRPDGSDRLDAWLSLNTIATKSGEWATQSHEVNTEIGWSWRSSHGILVDAIIARQLRLGLREEEWLASIKYERLSQYFNCQDGFDIEEDDSNQLSEQLCKRDTRKVTVNAERTFANGIWIELGGGAVLAHYPIIELSLGWRPDNLVY